MPLRFLLKILSLYAGSTNNFIHLVPGAIPDLVALPELRWLEKYFLIPPLSLAVSLYGAHVLCCRGCSASALRACWAARISNLYRKTLTSPFNKSAHLHGVYGWVGLSACGRPPDPPKLPFD